MARTVSTGSEIRGPSRLNAYPLRTPKFWHGMRWQEWLPLWLPNFFRVHPRRVPMALLVTLISGINSLLYRVQQGVFNRAIANTPIDHPPLFVIGHWRSGTTYLHELLVMDERFAFPTTYECFAPRHFLVSGAFLAPLIRFLLPDKRPMDDMPTGVDLPQEDEFALCILGAPSPYLRMAFPNDPPPYLEFLDMEGVKERDLARWKSRLLYFVRALTLRKRKRLVLKSPPHTGRISVLRELFPGAQFVHIVRDPLAIFPSTRRMWHALDSIQGFQPPRDETLTEYVFLAFERMYGGFRRQSAGLGPGELCEVRYEDLIRDPVTQVERIYAQLELGDFEPVRARLEEFVGSWKDYSPNQYELADPLLQAEIRRRWGWYFERYGYTGALAGAPPPHPPDGDPAARPRGA